MTILLTQAIQVAGVTQPAGTTLTLEAGLEADLVTRKCATFVSRPDQGITAEVFARTDPLTGRIRLSAAGKGINLTGKYPGIDAIGGVVAFWDFSEPRAPYLSKSGMGVFPLSNGAGGRVTKGTGGPLSNSVVFNGTSDYLVLSSTNVGELNLGKSGNSAFVLAFVKRGNSSSTSFIAGCWQEDHEDPRRQYALFVDLPTYGGDNKVCFHVSKTGDHSPNIPYSRDYSSNGSSEPGRDWSCISGSYDGSYARSYIEGVFEPYYSYTEPGPPNGESLTYNKNPYAFSLGLNDTDCDFTVGACKVTGVYSNFFNGELAALLVMNRAPTMLEIAQIQNAISPASTGFKSRLFQWSTVNSAPNAIYGCHAYRQTSDDSATLASWQRTTTGTPEQGFIYRPSSSVGNAMLTLENIAEGITTGNASTFTFQMANAATGDAVRFCVKIDSNWYATESTYSVAVASPSGSDWTNAETKTITFALTAASWRDITLVAGSSLVLAGAARGSDLPSGTIAGVGIYSPSTPTGNIRVRNFEITTI